MTTTPTSETDAEQASCYGCADTDWVPANFARKLERERDEAKENECKIQSRVFELLNERDQLRKVCDELANKLKKVTSSWGGLMLYEANTKFIISRNMMDGCKDLTSYNSLPHVIERNKTT